MRTKGIGPNNLGMSKSSPSKMMASPAKKDPPTKAQINLRTASNNNAREALKGIGIDNPNMSDEQVRKAATGKGLMRAAKSKAIKTQQGVDNSNSNK